MVLHSDLQIAECILAFENQSLDELLVSWNA